MARYEVGMPYQAGVTHWAEIPEYSYRGGAHEIVHFIASPSALEIQSIQTGMGHFALAIEQGVIILLFRFEPAISWKDAGFTIHQVPEAERLLPPADAPEDLRAPLRVILVDADTGIVRAIRHLTFSPEFTRRLHAEIMRQAETPFDRKEYEETERRVFSFYTTMRLLEERAVYRCIGGG